MTGNNLKTPKFAGTLYFLNDIKISPEEELKAPWLLSDFYENKWLIKHSGHEKLYFDWHRIMPTGIYLTSNGTQNKSQNSRITTGEGNSSSQYQVTRDYRDALNILKKIIFFLAHRRISKRCNFSFHFQFFTRVMALAEWVFLHEERFNPRERLFELIDTNDLQNEFIPLTLLGGKTQLLNIESRLKIAFSEILNTIKKDTLLLDELHRNINQSDELSYIDPIIKPWLIFSETDTSLLRAWLQNNNYYFNTAFDKGRLKYEILFEDVLHQKIKYDTLSPQLQLKLRAFCATKNVKTLDFSAANLREYLNSGEQYLHEKVNDEITVSESAQDSWILTFKKLHLISHHLDSGLPKPAIFKGLNLNFSYHIPLRPKGRTKTIPAEIAMHALGEAIHYMLVYGEALVDMAIKVRKELQENGSDNFKANYSLSYYTKFSSKYAPSLLTPPKTLADLNITQLGDIYRCTSLKKFNSSGGNARAAAVRDHMGLEDALTLLLASAIVIIGTTAARRQTEIRTLSKNCLEKVTGQGWYLRFNLGKDNFGNLKSKPSRCIPNIAAKAIKLISRLNSAWQEIHNTSSEDLFYGFTANLNSCEALSRTRLQTALDTFSDYIEMPLDNKGKRWYLRCHQFRRFWAYSFFYKMGLGELHTLGWYLGHAETEHTWSYILESFDGHDKELQQVKAAYAVDVLQNRQPTSSKNETAISEIKSLVLKHFNKKNFELVEKNELEDFIENLISENDLDVEPKFIHDENGNSYDLIWLLNKKN